MANKISLACSHRGPRLPSQRPHRLPYSQRLNKVSRKVQSPPLTSLSSQNSTRVSQRRAHRHSQLQRQLPNPSRHIQNQQVCIQSSHKFNPPSLLSKNQLISSSRDQLKPVKVLLKGHRHRLRLPRPSKPPPRLSLALRVSLPSTSLEILKLKYTFGIFLEIN